MKTFDRDYFGPWQGALATAMWDIDEPAQRRHGPKEPGLRWGKSASGVRRGACPMPRIARRPAPAPEADLPPSNASIWSDHALKAGDAYPLGPIARGWRAGASMMAMSLVSIVFYPHR
ncbi:MAG: hypothetical protein V3S87_11470, partial [Alphaproteobacteria bacterium]